MILNLMVGHVPSLKLPGMEILLRTSITAVYGLLSHPVFGMTAQKGACAPVIEVAKYVEAGSEKM